MAHQYPGSVWIVYGVVFQKGACTEGFKRWMVRYEVARLESLSEGFMIPVASTSLAGAETFGVKWLSPDTVVALDDLASFISPWILVWAQETYEGYRVSARRAGFDLPEGRLYFVCASDD